MATLHVRELPDSTLTVLRVRAAKAGQSVQAYVLQLLNREATVLSPEEAAIKASEIANRSSVTADDVLSVIEESRQRFA